MVKVAVLGVSKSSNPGGGTPVDRKAGFGAGLLGLSASLARLEKLMKLKQRLSRKKRKKTRYNKILRGYATF